MWVSDFKKCKKISWIFPAIFSHEVGPWSWMMHSHQTNELASMRGFCWKLLGFFHKPEVPYTPTKKTLPKNGSSAVNPKAARNCSASEKIEVTIRRSVEVFHTIPMPHLEINCPRPLRPQKSSFGSAFCIENIVILGSCIQAGVWTLLSMAISTAQWWTKTSRL